MPPVPLMCLASLLVATAAPAPPLRWAIDELVAAGWKERGVAPAPASDDAEFFRRTHLDLTGMIPTPGAVRSFLDDRSPAKRDRLIDRLTASPEFSLHMARVVDVMLVERRTHAVTSYDVPTREWRGYLAAAFADGRPWDRLVAEILAADGGDGPTRPAVRFYLARNVQPHDLTRDVGRLLLGRDLSCAQCHDDPRYRDYTQADYYGLYAFVGRLSFFRDLKANRSFVSEKPDGKVDFTSVFTGQKGRSEPRLPGGKLLPDPATAGPAGGAAVARGTARIVPAYSRRLLLARELPRRETPGFSRNAANRFWALLMGRGLVHPLDLHRAGNRPSHPELLDLLARRFEGMNFDVRAFVRELARTRAYQLSSRRPAGAVAPPPEAFAVAALRPLSPDQFAWSVARATGRLEAHLAAAEAALRARDPKGHAATRETLAWRQQAYAGLERETAALAAQFAGPPGRPAGEFEPSVNQALFLLNGPTLTGLLRPARGHLLEMLARETDPGRAADALYLQILSRLPAPDEAAEVRDHLATRRDRAAALGELAGALLMTAEFRLNH